MPKPIRIALIGAGLFAKEAHVPALNALVDQFEVAAVYSRTRATAEALLEAIAGMPDIYTDLGSLLQRSDIEAVNIILPIDALPAAIDLAFAAGKHVISEKPIAPDVASGRRLISIYKNHPQQVWMVAENWRYEPSFRRAGEIIRSGEIGKVIVVQWSLYLPTRPGNPYYATAWRRTGTFPGGFLLDGGVHHIAAFRQMVGEITHVSAAFRQMLPDLPPADTMNAIIEFESGVIGSYTVTYAAGMPFPTYLTVIGEKGVLRVTSFSLEVSVDDIQRSEDYNSNENVKEELIAFANAIRSETRHNNSPLEGLRDVAVIEAMLKSGESGARVEVEPLVDLEKSL